jgi:adenylate cyclase
VPDQTVLVVDDDPMVVRILQMAFELEGYRVLTASDGEEGLRRGRDDRPDVILLDIMMPKLDGIAVAKALKGDASTASIPVILVSAKTSDDDRKRGLASGADDYVTKPFQQKALVERVKQLIAGAG